MLKSSLQGNYTSVLLNFTQVAYLTSPKIYLSEGRPEKIPSLVKYKNQFYCLTGVC